MQPVLHPQIGMYFDRFVPGSGYIPNSDVSFAYPDDL